MAALIDSGANIYAALDQIKLKSQLRRVTIFECNQLATKASRNCDTMEGLCQKSTLRRHSLMIRHCGFVFVSVLYLFFKCPILPTSL